MFHSLFSKLRASSSWRSETRISRPLVELWAIVKRRASMPWLSFTSRASIMFPRERLIFWPCSSTTNGVMRTSRNGTSSMKWRPIITIRATQKKRMSNAVTRTDVG